MGARLLLLNDEQVVTYMDESRVLISSILSREGEKGNGRLFKRKRKGFEAKGVRGNIDRLSNH